MNRAGHVGPVASRIGSLGAILGFWIGAAVLTGLLHGAELVVARMSGGLAWFSREFLWMSPVAYALVMAPGALVLGMLAIIVRRRWVLPFSAACFVVVGVFGLLLPYSQVSRISSLILALGAGVVAARAVNANAAGWMRCAHVAAIAGPALVIILAPAQRLMLRSRESRAVAALPDAQPDATNVLVIILDTVRAASMSLYGNPQPTTPRLEEWSRSATVFDWAFSPAPWTLPSHASMFTGEWAGEQSGDWERPLDRTFPTLAEHFRDRGYLTAGFVGNMHYTAWDSGLRRGFAHYEDYLVSRRQLLRSSSYTQTALFDQLRDAATLGDMARVVMRPNLAIDIKHKFALKRGDRITDAFLDWQAANSTRPFFAFLNYFDGHQPYYAPPPFRRFTGEKGLGEYLSAIAFLDAEIDRVLVTLKERGVLDKTLVIVTSDHGELFGFKGLSGHANNLYINTLRIPLFIRLPGRVPEGLRATAPVTLRDLSATVIDLAAPGPAPAPGGSLAAAWTGRGLISPVLAEVTKARNVPANYPTALGDMQTLIDDRWQLIRNGDDRLELYEYRVDTLQERNLAGSDSAAAVLAAMRQRLLELLRPPR